MTDRDQPARRSGSWRVTGVLHAGAVSDRHLPLIVFPDDGNGPIPLSYRPDQLTTLRLCLCRRITVEGTAEPGPAGAVVLRLTGVTPTPLATPVTVRVDRPVTAFSGIGGR